MRCPDCGARAEVLDSRPRPDGDVRRRRHCTSCDKRFTTIERARVGNDELAAQFARLALQLADRDPVGITNGSGMSWEPRVPYRSRTDSLVDVACLARELSDPDDRLVARTVAIDAAIYRGHGTARSSSSQGEPKRTRAGAVAGQGRAVCLSRL